MAREGGVQRKQRDIRIKGYTSDRGGVATLLARFNPSNSNDHRRPRSPSLSPPYEILRIQKSRVSLDTSTSAGRVISLVDCKPNNRGADRRERSFLVGCLRKCRG